MSRFTPNQLAELDQEKAGLEEHLDVVIAVYKGLRSNGTALSAACDLTAWLPTQYDVPSVAAMLATAIERLEPEVLG